MYNTRIKFKILSLLLALASTAVRINKKVSNPVKRKYSILLIFPLLKRKRKGIRSFAFFVGSWIKLYLSSARSFYGLLAMTEVVFCAIQNE